MPVQFDDTPELPPDDSELTSGADTAELTSLPEVALEVHPLDAPSGVQVNRAAADALALTHVVVHQQDRRAGPPESPPVLTPEEKLLHAIFGAQAGPNLPFLEADGTPLVGTVVPRGAVVLFDERDRAKVAYTAEESGEVTEVVRTTEGLPEGVALRVAVTLRARGPLCVGDALWEGERRVGVVDAITDDGASEPRVYLGRAEIFATRGPVARVSRRLPTARQQLEARAIGEYGRVSRRPETGELVRAGQRRFLAERGCLALFNDFASLKCDERALGSMAHEALIQAQPVTEPSWPEDAAPGASAGESSSAVSDIFSFFEKPKAQPAPEREALKLARALARSLGIGLESRPSGLALSVLADPTAGSQGEVQNDLFAQRLFGPTRDYHCECGALNRMAHRGQVCPKCGVTAMSSSLRRTNFAHIRLATPVAHPWLGTTLHAVPVLPPDLRANRASELNALYARVLAERSPPAVTALLEHLASRLRELLTEDPEVRVDYSGRAVVLIDPSLAPDRCVAPAALLAGIGQPLLIALSESLGYVTTLKSARRLLERDPVLCRAFAEHVFANRPLLLANPEGSRTDVLVAAHVEVGDEPVIRLPERLAARLAVQSGDLAVAHLPVSAGAVREAHWLASAGERDALRGVSDLAGGASWLKALAGAPRDAFALRLSEYARAGAVDPCGWPAAAFLRGGYPVLDDAGLVDPPDAAPFVAPSGADPEGAANTARDALLARRVEELELSVRTANALSKLGVSTLRDLVQHSETDLLRAKRITPKSLAELRTILAELGLSLGMSLQSASVAREAP